MSKPDSTVKLWSGLDSKPAAVKVCFAFRMIAARMLSAVLLAEAVKPTETKSAFSMVIVVAVCVEFGELGKTKW